MKIVIAGGTHEAEYIIHMFHKRGNELVVINPSEEQAKIILFREEVNVYVGNPSRRYALEESGARDADVVIALSERDADNYAICVLAKKMFGAKRCICVVNNPNNVDLFKRLGIDSVISSTYLLGDSVKNESSVEDIIRAISFEDNQVTMIEATVLPRFKIAYRKIADCAFPRYASISCIIRAGEVIIPNGQIQIRPKDKLMMMCSPNDQNRLTAFIKQEKAADEQVDTSLDDDIIPIVDSHVEPVLEAPVKKKVAPKKNGGAAKAKPAAKKK